MGQWEEVWVHLEEEPPARPLLNNVHTVVCSTPWKAGWVKTQPVRAPTLWLWLLWGKAGELTEPDRACPCCPNLLRWEKFNRTVLPDLITCPQERGEEGLNHAFGNKLRFDRCCDPVGTRGMKKAEFNRQCQNGVVKNVVLSQYEFWFHHWKASVDSGQLSDLQSFLPIKWEDRRRHLPNCVVLTTAWDQK